MTHLTDQVLAGDYSSRLIGEIFQYQDYWGKDDPIGRNIKAHTAYLLALIHLQTGEIEKTIDVMYEIWSNYPETIWAFLASEHLEKLNSQ